MPPSNVVNAKNGGTDALSSCDGGWMVGWMDGWLGNVPMSHDSYPDVQNQRRSNGQEVLEEY